MSTLIGLFSPTRAISPSWIARRAWPGSGRRLGDLVEEERAAVGLLEQALRAETAPVNAPRACRTARSPAASR
jgi:hypothetical protein